MEGQAATITPNHLSFPGIESADHLVYTISHPLGPHDGSLFHIDSPGLEIRQFTQSDVNDMKIIYMPPLEDIGDEEKVTSFKFKSKLFLIIVLHSRHNTKSNCVEVRAVDSNSSSNRKSKKIEKKILDSNSNSNPNRYF